MRCYSHLSDDEREQIGLAKSFRPFDRRDRASDRPFEIDDLARLTHVLASHAARGGQEAHGFTITAVQCEGVSQSLKPSEHQSSRA